MQTYATREHLAEWLTPEDLPDATEAKRWLQVASERVRTATRADIYSTDPAGYPDDPEEILAFRDATCAQITEWIEADLNPFKGVAGQELLESKSSIAGGTIELDTNGSAEARARALTILCDRGYDILRNAGLASNAPGFH
ncbi:hypothetical protein RCF19_29800 [Rhodococcus qingshengii]